MGKTEKITLTPEQERWLVAHFRHTTNPEIARRLGISETTMHRFARKLGLTKSRQHMRKTQRNAADKARESHLRNGTYPPKGYIIPRSEEFRFKAGVTSVERLGKRKERKRIERSAESRRRTLREERARALFGVPRKTGLRVVREPRGKTCQRWYLRKRGYIIDEANLIAYWTEDTRRATILEKRPRQWYRFRPLEERIDLFVETHPELDIPYGDLFAWHHTLTGSCEFGRREWCKAHGYQPDDSITVRTFIEQTRNDYGGDVIRQLAGRYGLTE